MTNGGESWTMKRKDETLMNYRLRGRVVKVVGHLYHV